MATAGTALAASNASTNAQIQSLQKQLNQLQMKVNNMNTSAPMSMKGVRNVLSLNANLSQQMMSNQSGVGREMYLLKARQMGMPNQSLTLGGRLEADALYQHTNNPGYFSNPVASNSSSSSSPWANVHTSSVGK